MLELQNIAKSFGDHTVLSSLSFSVAPGEIFGFVGANGAGKTTTMRIILGLLSKDAGTVTWNGAPIDFEARKQVGYMPEERGLYPKAKVETQLLYFAGLHGLSRVLAAQRVKFWTDRLGVGNRRGDAVQKLSLGNQQRVQLAAALVSNPKLLILDEPFSGLDPVAVDVMSEVLREAAGTGVPVIFSSHQLDLVERLCDRVGILSSGRMEAVGTIDELRTQGGTALALATGADPAVITAALTAAKFTVIPDPQAGTPDAPVIPGATRLLLRDSTATRPGDASPDRSQEALRIALAHGPVFEFARRRPHLAELFREAVTDTNQPGDADAASPATASATAGSPATPAADSPAPTSTPATQA
ncbi:ABC transporter ATP-binding protein [Neoactinobaculum massilliense]|uniref:ABC transporter ATP-binding protein n=1 Tax=Neoactinobaculum massilliense TaxID=2364794 RepID=UPI000F52ADCA|nr:ATP-binding cassette domain-containing protein [Neoactinobaculum massilliense]